MTFPASILRNRWEQVCYTDGRLKYFAAMQHGVNPNPDIEEYVKSEVRNHLILVRGRGRDDPVIRELTEGKNGGIHLRSGAFHSLDTYEQDSHIALPNELLDTIHSTGNHVAYIIFSPLEGHGHGMMTRFREQQGVVDWMLAVDEEKLLIIPANTRFFRPGSFCYFWLVFVNCNP